MTPKCYFKTQVALLKCFVFFNNFHTIRDGRSQQLLWKDWRKSRSFDQNKWYHSNISST